MAPGRSKVEEGREEEAKGQENKMENEVIRRIIAGVPQEADTVGGDEWKVGRKDDWNGIEQSLKQMWDCSQIEEDVGEGRCDGLV